MDPGAQVKRVHGAVGRNVPALRLPGNRREVLRILGDKVLDQALKNVVLGHALHDVRVEFLRVGFVALVQDLLLVADAHSRGRLAAAGEEKQSREYRQRRIPKQKMNQARSHRHGGF
ncbi:MAG: hypothetical protein HYX46_04735 [Betaproteobacteria bacterium]|nr:hypothetical protein [Betaproteobacteria bacterium]